MIQLTVTLKRINYIQFNSKVIKVIVNTSLIFRISVRESVWGENLEMQGLFFGT